MRDSHRRPRGISISYLVLQLADVEAHAELQSEGSAESKLLPLSSQGLMPTLSHSVDDVVFALDESLRLPATGVAVRALSQAPFRPP